MYHKRNNKVGIIRVNCAVCQRQTQPVRIDGQDYCSVCGNLYSGQPAKAAQSARSMDMVANRPAGGSAPLTLSAAQFHHRPPQHVIDLREQAQAQAPSPTASAAGHNVVAQPAAAPEHHMAKFTDRFDRARQFSRSSQISRFGTDRLGNVKDPHQMYDKFGNRQLQTIVDQTHHTGAFADPKASAPAPAAMPNHVVTQHRAMAQLTPLPPAPAAPAAPKSGWRPHLSLSPGAGRFATTAAAVVILGGYVWLQNYPKLAVQNAGSQAGLTAALPSYIPSSYSLAGTTTNPGLLTLKFTSPSADTPLTIAQRRTSWDPNSLLDNYVAKNSDDYAAVEGQGLTIYLFGNNNATWVNHGVWYSIAGADRLSRDQILKIAYSL